MKWTATIRPPDLRSAREWRHGEAPCAQFVAAVALPAQVRQPCDARESVSELEPIGARCQTHRLTGGVHRHRDRSRAVEGADKAKRDLTPRHHRPTSRGCEYEPRDLAFEREHGAVRCEEWFRASERERACFKSTRLRQNRVTSGRSGSVGIGKPKSVCQIARHDSSSVARSAKGPSRVAIVLNAAVAASLSCHGSARRSARCPANVR